jgi:hypothetical protein
MMRSRDPSLTLHKLVLEKRAKTFCPFETSPNHDSFYSPENELSARELNLDIGVHGLNNRKSQARPLAPQALSRRDEHFFSSDRFPQSLVGSFHLGYSAVTGYRPSDTDGLDIRKQRPYAPEIVSEVHLARARDPK